MRFPTLSALQSDTDNAMQVLDQSNSDLDDGGRALRAIVRPYPAKVAGVPLRWAYEVNTGQIEFEWYEPGGEELRCRETEVFYPAMLLTEGRAIQVDGLAKEAWRYDAKRQTLFIVPPSPIKFSSGGNKRRIVIRANSPLEPLFAMTTHWDDFAKWYAGVGVVVLAIVGYLLKVLVVDG